MTREQPTLKMNDIQAYYCFYAPKISSAEDYFFYIYNTTKEWLDGKDGKVQLVNHGKRKKRPNNHMRVNDEERTTSSVNVSGLKSKMTKQCS